MFWRILLGPFTRDGIAAYHYGVRIMTISIINMLTLKTSLNILFIRDFDRMAAISETKVMAWMCVTTLVSTVAHIIEEAITRNSRGLNHFARWCFNTYLGKVGLSYHSVLLLVLILLQGNIATPLKNEAGTGDLRAIPLTLSIVTAQLNLNSTSTQPQLEFE